MSITNLSDQIGLSKTPCLNRIKKLERDDDNILTDQRKSKIIEEMGDVMWYFTGILNRLNTSIDTVLKTNMDKLK